MSTTLVSTKQRLRWDISLLAALLVAAIYFAYLVARAFLIPITVDEAATCMNSVPRSFMDVLTYRADPVPNNHILNTLGIQLFSGIFGLNHLSARLPALIGGLLYLYATMGLAARLSSRSWVRAFAVILLLGNHFLTEFFSLARGYGLASGLMLFAVLQAWIYLENKQLRVLLLAMSCALLSVEANFTLLNFFLPFAGLLLIFSILRENEDSKSIAISIRWQPILIIALGAAATALLCYGPLKRIVDTNQLQYWGTTSFWKETLIPSISSAIQRQAAGRDMQLFVRPFAVLVLATAVAGWCWWLWQTVRMPRPNRTQTLVVGLFAGTVLVNIAQAWLIQTPYLNARTALFFYPLWALQLAVCTAWAAEKWPRVTWLSSGLLSLLVLYHFFHGVNLRKSYEWYFDDRTFAVLNTIRTLDNEEIIPLTLDVNAGNINAFRFHVMHANWPHYAQSVQVADWHGQRLPQKDTDLYLSNTAEEEAVLPPEYVMIKDFGANFKLWRKK